MSELKPAVSGSPPRVRVEVEYLMNLGNFENAKIVIGIEDDVRPGEHVDDTFNRLYAKADEQLGRRSRAFRDNADNL